MPKLSAGLLLYRVSDGGVEVLIARNWVKEEFWPRIQDAVHTGYPAEKTYTFMRAHAERRRTRRPKK